MTQNALIQIDNTSPGTITLPWWRGLCVPVNVRDMLSGVCAPGRVSHDQVVSDEGPDEEWFRADQQAQQAQRGQITILDGGHFEFGGQNKVV